MRWYSCRTVESAPGLGRLVEPIQREGLLALEHGHQPSLDAAPEGFLLGVLVRAVRQRGLMNDTQSGQAGDEFLAHHRRAVVRHHGPWQVALHERLRQAMHEGLGRLVEVPLQVTDQARAVVDEADQHRRGPQAGSGEDLARAMVEVKMKQRAHVLDFEAAHLQLFEPVAGQHRAVACSTIHALGSGPPVHALAEREAPHRRIRGNGQASGLQRDAQVVQVQLGRPARVLSVLRRQDGNGLLAHAREATLIATQSVAQRNQRVVGSPGRVVPTLQRGDAEVHVQARVGATPRLGRQDQQRVAQPPRLGG